jgi:hypothetical protein
MNPTKKTARLAGLFFLLMVVFGLFAELFSRQKLLIETNAALTASNVLSNQFLFRSGIVSDILMAISYLFTGFALYKLFFHVNKHLSAMMVILTTAGSIMVLGNIMSEFSVLTILREPAMQSAFNANQLQALAMERFISHQDGYVVGQVFFGLWVLPLGIMITKSKFIPKFFGICFILETIGALLAVFIHFLYPNEALETTFMIPGIIAEISFMFWLLIRGINESKLSLVKAEL